ncbi:TonB-dependent receptor [Pelagicoccus mobilis]|uniref:TonB-dependent receptor n=1 Tax=Pelagicoccus mobilis TaxID=415221 RepID=A0A934RYZ1_9BACT|nr:TonB-dependent receptor [Pelagicoccus mobilis]MBK1879317.1 TonB-dependent receptor [Pelagicoccus mobilis]
MKKAQKRSLSAVAGLLLLFSSSDVGAQDTTPELDGEEVFELSPFSVDASEDAGYRATTTLAGTRLNTKLRDVGAAISVMTSEFFEDTGATDSQTLLSYGLNTETAGANGNFVGGNDTVAGGQRVDLESQRTNPQKGQRVRGLATAQLTRNYFETDIGFDSYNTDRVTINRGPNSLLFGIGSAGGVINNATLRASLTEEFGEVSVRLGERSSHRETFNYNKVLVEDRLAVRVAALYDDFNYQQRPTYEEKKRIFAAMESVLLKNENSEFFGPTVLRGNFESGDTESNPPQVTPPGDGISSWFSLPDPGPLEAITGTTFPAFFSDGSFEPKYTIDQSRPGLVRGDINGVAALPNFIQISMIYEEPNQGTGLTGTDLDASVMRAVRGFGGRAPNKTWDYFLNSSLYHEGYLPNFVTASLPLSVFDNENMSLAGTTNLATQDFDAANFTLEQTFFNGRGGIEFNYDRQNYATFRRFPFNSGGFQVSFNDVFVDINETRNDETPNPNLGRLMVITSGNRQASILGYETQDIDRESHRTTAFYDLDLRGSDNLSWMGRHVFTGVISSQSRDIVDMGVGAAWVSEDIDLGGSDYHFGNLNIGRRQVVSQIYLSDPLHNDPNIQSIDDVKITNYIDIPLPKDGSEYTAKTYNRTEDTFFTGEMTTRNYLNSFERTRREIDTEVISMQSYLLNDNVVGLLGYRKDKQTNWKNEALVRKADGEVDLDASNILDRLRDPLSDEVLAPEEGDTVTWSVVAHTPDAWMDKLNLPGSPRLSFHYNESENFNPVGVRTDIEGFQIASPAGETKEYGFSLELLEDRVFMRFNWFETDISNDTADVNATIHSRIGNWLSRWNDAENAGMTIEEALAITPGNTFDDWTSYEDAYSDIVGLLPDRIQAIYNYRIENNDNEDDLDQIANPSATRSFSSEGFELDVVANLTENWRVMLNAGQQETVQNDIAPKVAAVAAEINSNILGSPFADVWDAPILAESFTFTTRWQNENFNSLLATLSQEGTQSLEQREWRVNAVTTYDFKDGKLAGFGVGGSLRYQSKAATGYPLVLNSEGIPLPDLDNPFWGPDQMNGDLWLKYSRPLFGDKVDWRIQLNVRNAFGDDDVIPVVTNPDGQLAVFRNSLPRETFLTNTFSF